MTEAEQERARVESAARDVCRERCAEHGDPCCFDIGYAAVGACATCVAVASARDHLKGVE